MGSEKQLKEDVDSFATYFYNWHFEKSLKYCTPESGKWLRFISTNVTEDDVEALRAKDADATIEIKDIVYCEDNDTIATAILSVTDVLTMGEIGQPATKEATAEYALPLVLRNGRWMVRMESLPRNERQSRDSSEDE